VEVINGIGARIGDRVDVSISGPALLKTTFILYVVPVLCLLIGGFAGDTVAKALGHTDTSPLAATFAIGSLIAALSFVKRRGNRMARETVYRPRVIRITQRAG
jgi:sigma-E factor negative regulatory protein RseC